MSVVLGIFGADWFYLSVSRSILSNILLTNMSMTKYLLRPTDFTLICWIENANSEAGVDVENDDTN